MHELAAIPRSVFAVFVSTCLAYHFNSNTLVFNFLSRGNDNIHNTANIFLPVVDGDINRLLVREFKALFGARLLVVKSDGDGGVCRKREHDFC